jgi:hypothetical protein
MFKAKAELECSVTEKEHQLNLIKENLHIKNIQIEDRSQYIEDESKQQRRISNLSTINANNLNEITTTITEQDNSYLIIDTKDPNRPRFTLNELQKVLMEKNQLTVKLDQTKDELEQLRRL